MLESAVAIAIAVSTGLGVFASRLNARVNQIELRVAEKYIPREDRRVSTEKWEQREEQK
jgi:hypothetical protein